MPLLANNLWREMLGHAIDRATIGHGYQLAAFVYMPEHVHLIVYPLPEAGGIDKPSRVRETHRSQSGRAGTIEDLDRSLGR